MVDRAPDAITLLGFYGFQPLAWLGTGKLLIGLRSDSGTEGAVQRRLTAARQLRPQAWSPDSKKLYATAAPARRSSSSPRSTATPGT